MEYEHLSYSNRAEVEVMLRSENEELISKALVGIVFGSIDRIWVRDTLMAHVNHPDFWVANNAIVGLEELVLFNPSIDIEPIVECLKTVKADKHLSQAKSTIKGIRELWRRRNRRQP